METRAALLREVPGKWEVHTVELDEPRDHEVLVRVVATGLCHSDDHFATGDITVGHLPFCGGHEAAGIVDAGASLSAGSPAPGWMTLGSIIGTPSSAIG